MTIDEYKQINMLVPKEQLIKEKQISYELGYNNAINDAKSVILQTLDNEMLVDTLHLRLEQLKEGVLNE